MFKRLRARWRRWRYARITRRFAKLQQHIVDDLRTQIRELQEQLDNERITVRSLKKVIEQQDWVIERDRQRVKQEIVDFGGKMEPRDERL